MSLKIRMWNLWVKLSRKNKRTVCKRKSSRKRRRRKVLAVSLEGDGRAENVRSTFENTDVDEIHGAAEQESIEITIKLEADTNNCCAIDKPSPYSTRKRKICYVALVNGNAPECD